MNMTAELTIEQLIERNQELEERLEQAEQLINAIKAGEVDAFALTRNARSEVFTLRSGDYAYRILVENFPLGALNLSEEGIIVYTNSYFADLLGTTYSEIIGTPIFNFVKPESLATFRELFTQGFRGQSKGDITLLSSRGDLYVHVSFTSLSPTIPSVGMIVTDLTEKRQQDKVLAQKSMELQDSEEKFFKLFYLSPISMVVTDSATGQLVMVNDQFTRTFGYTAEETLGKTAPEIGIVKDPKDRERIIAQLRAEESVPDRELELVCKSGEVRAILSSSQRLHIGGKDYFLSVHHDITDRKRSEAAIAYSNSELQKLNKELQAFAYVSSHDLQEPLRKIQTFATRILEKEHDNLSPVGREQFGRMQVAARRMQTLIEDLLTYSRANLVEGAFQKTDLATIIDEIKEDLKDDLQAAHATIDYTDLCETNLIPFQFRQLMHNLIGNSLKFANPDEHPRIQIRSRMEVGKNLDNPELDPTTKYCHISVSDNGIGFEPQYKSKIFEVFQRLHPRSAYNGTGIGLAIVKKIVENHRGIISASSTPNCGATFDIYLPVTVQ